MSSVTQSILISCPIQKVWQQVTDLKQLGNWVTIHEELLDHDPLPLQVGFHMQQKLRLRGFSFHVHWELTQCNEPFLLTWNGEGPTGSHAIAQYELVEADQQTTQFCYTSSFQVPLGFLGKTASRLFVGNTAQQEAQASLEQLKAVLEVIR